MSTHPKGIKFSTTKPNVVVGPNGAGKSALLTALSLYTLTYFSGESTLDNHFVNVRDDEHYWKQVGYQWSNDFEYLHGLQCASDNALALYYRPGHIPGNESGITYAMMTGYFEQAKAYARLTENKSSGQQSQALLNKVQALLEGTSEPLELQYANWSHGKAPKEVAKDRGWSSNGYDHKAEKLKARFSQILPDAIPLVLMDEPEQSLDARAEALLWRQIEKTDASKVQVIVATHSLYPLMHPKAFNIIEAEPGYAKSVQSLL